MRIFLDTNVLVSAVATRGLCADVFREVLLEHQLIVSEVLIFEVETVLGEKLGLPPNVTASFVELIRQDAIISEAYELLSLEIRDESDLSIISSAHHSGAEYFITGDKELLELHQVGNMAILSPRMFWEKLTK